MNILSEALADISKRNAGEPVLTIWGDGSFVVHGERDAEIATLGDKHVLLNLVVETMNPINFRPLQGRVRLHEKLLLPATPKGSEVDRIVLAGEILAAQLGGRFRLNRRKLSDFLAREAAQPQPKDGER